MAQSRSRAPCWPTVRPRPASTWTPKRLRQSLIPAEVHALDRKTLQPSETHLAGRCYAYAGIFLPLICLRLTSGVTLGPNSNETTPLLNNTPDIRATRSLVIIRGVASA